MFDRSNTPALRDNGVRSLSVAPDGALVIGTSRGGVAIKRGNHWQTLQQSDGLAENGVVDALIDRRGRLWVASDSHGITRVTNGRFEQLNVANGALPSDALYSLAEDEDGSLWAATARGLVRMRDDGRVVFGKESGLPNAAITHLTITPNGEMLVGTERGAYRRIGKTARFELLSRLLPPDYVPSMAIDRSGNTWIGTTNNGLYRLSPQGVEHFTSDGKLPNNRVASMLVDREGTRWFGTNAGLLHLADTPFTTWGTDQGMSDNYVHTLARAGDGGVWAGTGRGLNLLRNGRVVASYSKADGLPGDSILSLQPSRDGSLLVGTYNNGLLRLRDGKVIAHLDNDGGMPGSNQVRAIVEQAEGDVWIGTTRGLVHWRNGTYRLYTQAEGLPRDFIIALHLASDGALWIGTSSGAAILHDGKIHALDIRAANDAKDAFAFKEDADGTVWIATDRGLIRWRKGRMRSLGLAQGLPLDTFFGVVDDGRGSFWLPSNRGVLRLRRRNVEAVLDGREKQLTGDHFGEADGLASAQCNGGSGPSSLLDAAGNVWVATAGGAATVKPGALHDGRPALSPVVLEQVLADDRPIDLPEGGTLELPAGTRKLEFRYAAVSFLIPRFLRYRHRLHGVDSDWISGGTGARCSSPTWALGTTSSISAFPRPAWGRAGARMSPPCRSPSPRCHGSAPAFSSPSCWWWCCCCGRCFAGACAVCASAPPNWKA